MLSNEIDVAVFLDSMRFRLAGFINRRKLLREGSRINEDIPTLNHFQQGVSQLLQSRNPMIRVEGLSKIACAPLLLRIIDGDPNAPELAKK